MPTSRNSSKDEISNARGLGKLCKIALLVVYIVVAILTHRYESGTAGMIGKCVDIIVEIVSKP